MTIEPRAKGQMHLHDLQEFEARLTGTLRGDDVEGLVRLGEEVEDDLGDPTLLREVTSRIVDIAQARGADAILGASPLGERLAGAAVAIAANGLRPLHRGGAKPGHVLIVDGILISGVQLRRAIMAARSAGATETSAVVVVGPTKDLRFVPEEISEIVVLADD